MTPMQKPTTDPAKEAGKKTVKETITETPKIGSVEVEAFAHNIARLVEEGGKALAAYMKPREEGKIKSELADDITDVVKTVGQVTEYWLSDPQRALEVQASLGRAYLDLWAGAVKRMAGEQAEPVVAPDPKDKRFADPEWSQNQFFDFLKQAYLLTAQWGERLVKDADGIDARTKAKAAFYVKQITNAISPSNFVLTNPELLRETMSSNAGNLVRGMHMLTEDIKAGHGNLKISQSDASQVRGRPQSRAHARQGDVPERPDAAHPIRGQRPGRAQGAAADRAAMDQQVLHSRSDAGKILHQMVRRSGHHRVRGVLGQSGRRTRREKFRAIHARRRARRARRRSRRATGEKKVNAIGYCVGGTLLAITLAYLAAKQKTACVSATLFAAQVDFTYAGDLMVFVDEERIEQLEAHMKEQGYLEASRMANAFNMLRSNDLIWPYVVNNYMRGKKPFPFDILYWNSDATRMPAANHSFYLRNCYLDNKLTKGEMKIAGETLDLHKVTVPVYNLATREDHIAPAKSVLYGSQFFGGPVKYVLAGSGHIAGVINPPGKPKYQYWTGAASRAAPMSTNGWPRRPSIPARGGRIGCEWLKGQGAETVPARDIGGGKLKPIEDAPGSYVKVKSWT